MAALLCRGDLRANLPVLTSLALHGIALAASLAWISAPGLSPPAAISVTLVVAGKELAGISSGAPSPMTQEAETVALEKRASSPSMAVAQSAEAAFPPPPPAKPKPPERPVRAVAERTVATGGTPLAAPAMLPAPPAPSLPSTPTANASSSLAGSSQRTEPSSIDADYLARILVLLERQQRYPEDARERQEQGTVVVALAINRAGDVLAVDVRKSSGSAALDDEARTMVQRAAPLPPIPASYTRARLDLLFPVVFALR